MADTGAFSIDLPLMSLVTADLEGLVCTGNSALSELGSLVLGGEIFGEIGSLVGSVDGQLHDNLLSSLTSGMGLFGTLNGALQCCASDYAALDTLVSDSFASLGLGGTLPSTPTAGSSPADVNKWWSGLSKDQQTALVATDPTKIGALDGVPDTVRDAANRKVLSNLQTQTQQQITDLKNTPLSPFDTEGFDAIQNQKQIDALQGKLDGMNELQKVLNDGGTNGAPQKFLLGIDTNGVGHAIVASGNPDTSANVVTVVPGVSTDLSAGHVDQYTKAADSIVASAHNADPNQSTSAVAWMNYNAPATVPGALFSGPAEAGGPVLDNFQQGLYATHDAGDPLHTTVIGHSYGTTVVGEATQAPGGLRADDVVLAASPGINVDNAAAMHVPNGTSHVWATRDDNDPIVWAEGFHNTDPVTPAFGAHVFNGGVGPSWDPIGAHDYYFDPSSPAMANFGQIATGHYGQVTSPPPVEPDPAWSFPMVP
ncbi:alpha/beta hydrolase [Catenulispora rubra]|uniref:alpha/beta hydrolase n=1 Tax=Catenulispora rubra TaxID=280293 RepID=UPI0018927C2E|nr:alpha/beta hydrolase [Catenulispora rubra]